MTSNNPFTLLMHEHEIISSAAEIIQKLNNSWNDDENSYKAKVQSLLSFFREYSDQFHHRKEEEVLFKQLRDNPDFILEDIIDELEGHHESFRDTVIEIEEYLNDSDYNKVQELLAEYIDELLDHIAVENDELFITAENMISQEDQERIYFLFQDLDMELGQDNKQRLVENLKQLKGE